jgi:hypothetical protein
LPFGVREYEVAMFLVGKILENSMKLIYTV